MADFEISGRIFRKCIDLMAEAGDPELDAAMETFDEIQGQANQGRAVLVKVEPFSLEG
jgi:hypothetical protein